MELDSKTQNAWNNAQKCYCGSQDCRSNHKICYICGGKMIYGAHESVEQQRNSSCAWNTDNIQPRSKNGTNQNSNLVAVHITCNRNKANKIIKR